MASKIEWTGSTWNPIVGCSVVSPGCTNCYAMRMAARLERMGRPQYAGLTKPTKAGPVWTGEVRLVESALTLPLRTKKPTTWFVNSMSDLFHEGVPDEAIDRVFAVMALYPQHTFQVLTKRSDRMRAYLRADHVQERIWLAAAAVAAEHSQLVRAPGSVTFSRNGGVDRCEGPWPLPNVWLGVSAEDQRRADERVPDLLATPAAIRFVSAEPLLGPIDFRPYLWASAAPHGTPFPMMAGPRPGEFIVPAERLDWIIVGGESGPGARPMHPEWERQIREACEAAGVAYFRKQWGAWKACPSNDGEWPVDAPGHIRLQADGTRGPDGWPMQRVGKRAAGRLLDGVEHNGFPSPTGNGRRG